MTKFDQVANQAVAALEEFQGVMREVRSLLGKPELQCKPGQDDGDVAAGFGRGPDALQSFELAGEAIRESRCCPPKARWRMLTKRLAVIRDAAKVAERSLQQCRENDSKPGTVLPTPWLTAR